MPLYASNGKYYFQDLGSPTGGNTAQEIAPSEYSKFAEIQNNPGNIKAIPSGIATLPLKANVDTGGGQVPRFGTNRNISFGGISELDKAQQELYGTPEERRALTDQDRLAINERVRKQFEDYQGAIEKVFAEEFATEDVRLGRELDRSRAISNARGTLGSSFEREQETPIREESTKIKGSIQNRKMLALQNLFVTIDAKQVDEAKSEEARRKGKSEEYLKSLNARKEDVRARVGRLAGAGFDLADLADDEVQSILDAGDFASLDDLKTYYASQPKNVNVEGFNTKIENGKLTASWFNKNTGALEFKVHDLGFGSDKYDKSNYDSETGNIILWNEKTGEAEVIKATGGKAGGGTGSTDDTKEYNFYVSQERAAGRTPIPFIKWQTKGEVGEDPETTKALKDAQTAIDAGADPDKVRKRFLENYPKKGDLFLKYFKYEF